MQISCHGGRVKLPDPSGLDFVVREADLENWTVPQGEPPRSALQLDGLLRLPPVVMARWMYSSRNSPDPRILREIHEYHECLMMFEAFRVCLHAVCGRQKAKHSLLCTPQTVTNSLESEAPLGLWARLGEPYSVLVLSKKHRKFTKTPKFTNNVKKTPFVKKKRHHDCQLYCLWISNDHQS